MLLSLTDYILVCPASGIGCATNNFAKSSFSMKSQPLCYDMGNAGDLLKHGILAEYTQWWCFAFSDNLLISEEGNYKLP
jgi:hypothetical protein